MVIVQYHIRVLLSGTALFHPGIALWPSNQLETHTGRVGCPSNFENKRPNRGTTLLTGILYIAI